VDRTLKTVKAMQLKSRVIEIGTDGHCSCSCADVCPLRRTGMAYRCAEAELMAAGISTQRIGALWIKWNKSLWHLSKDSARTQCGQIIKMTPKRKGIMKQEHMPNSNMCDHCFFVHRRVNKVRQ
jgi:hypothetical protein